MATASSSETLPVLIKGESAALKLEVHAVSGKARACTLTLPHGPVLTPVFMPVGTQVPFKFLFMYLLKIGFNFGAVGNS